MRIFFLVCVQPPLALVQPSARVLFLQFDAGKKSTPPQKNGVREKNGAERTPASPRGRRQKLSLEGLEPPIS